MSQPPSPFVPYRISAEKKDREHEENERSELSILAMAALSTAAQVGDIPTTKKLVELGVVEDFMADLDIKERMDLVEGIKMKLENVEQLVATQIVFIPDRLTVEKNPFAKGLIKVIFIPGTDFRISLVIDREVVRDWSPAKSIEGCFPLHYLCSLPDVSTEAVKDLLECNPFDLNQRTSTGYTALIIAIIRGNYPLVKFLVEKGASLDCSPIIRIKIEELGSYYPYLQVFSQVKVTLPQMHYYFTPLEAAVFSNHEDILCYLVRKGASVHMNKGLWNSLYHPIIMGRRRIVERLLESGVDINGTDQLGTAPLHKAAGEGCIDLTHVLMRRGANVNARDKYGWTPLHVACLFSRNVSLEMIQLLLDGGADIEAKTKFGFTPLCLAEAGNDLFFVEYLAENMDKLGSSTTHMCLPEDRTRKEHEDIITLLLDNGASCNHQDDFLGWSALHWAAASGDLRTAQLLVSRGAKVSIRSKFNFSPYQTAMYFKRGPVCAFLMSVTDESPTNE